MFRAGVIGASGFAGVQACFILDQHPNFSLELIGSEKFKGQRLSELYSSTINSKLGDEVFVSKDDPKFCDLDVVFLAVPHKTAMDVSSKLVKNGVVVIDLSADFRLSDPEVYEKWYETKHTQIDLLNKRAFGLPEIYFDDLKQVSESRKKGEAALVACAGCYVTATSLAAKPFVESSYFDENFAIVADAISGLTGAGKNPGDRGLYVNASQNFEAYGVTKHRHTPEIEQILNGKDVIFTPHLAPANRGILSTVTMKVNETKTNLDQVKLLKIYLDFYERSHFVKVIEKDGLTPKTRNVAGSNFANISVHLNEEKGYVIAICAIDNLVKGAAGQAIQCANIVFDLPEEAGLDSMALPI